MPHRTTKKSTAPQGTAKPRMSDRAALNDPECTLKKIVMDIRLLERGTITSTVEIGRLLKEASEIIKHGEYADWLKTNFGGSSKTAYRYRAIYELSEEYADTEDGNCQIDNFGALNISLTALYLAAACAKGNVM